MKKIVVILFVCLLFVGCVKTYNEHEVELEKGYAYDEGYNQAISDFQKDYYAGYNDGYQDGYERGQLEVFEDPWSYNLTRLED